MAAVSAALGTNLVWVAIEPTGGRRLQQSLVMISVEADAFDLDAVNAELRRVGARPLRAVDEPDKSWGAVAVVAGVALVFVGAIVLT